MTNLPSWFNRAFLWLIAGAGALTILSSGRGDQPPTVVGRLPRGVIEASGMASSSRTDDVWWTHNDHGAQPILYAMQSDGTLRGRVRLSGATAYDWEDIASFTAEGRSWLLVADVGDNQMVRPAVMLHLVEEPAEDALRPGAELTLPVAATLVLRYPDGPQDCEGVAVDMERREILLISKRSSPPQLYRVCLSWVSAEVIAERIGSVPGLPGPTWTDLMQANARGLLRGLPTGLAISPDGRRAAVLTYGTVGLYRRGHDETWSAAFARRPLLLAPHQLAQAEGVGFSQSGGHLLVTTEGRRGSIVRYDVAQLNFDRADDGSDQVER